MMMRRTVRSFFSLSIATTWLATSFFFIGTMIVARVADAAVQTGQVGGAVSGPDGTAIPGATVTLEGKNLMGKRVEKTDDQGRYKFVEIPPGSYTVTIEATGYIARPVPVSINIDRLANVDVSLQPPEAGGQEITITENKSTIDVTQTQGGEVINKDFLTKLPVSQDYLSVARMIPGVIGSGNSNVQGAGSGENQFLVDGVNITDPVTNTFSANFNFESIEQVEVLTGGFDPEHQALGGIINVVTKSGGNDFHGGASTNYLDNQWSPRRPHRCGKYDDGYTPTGNDLDDQERCADIIEFSERGTRTLDSDTNLWLGGPIVRDKVWFFTSYQFASNLSKSYGAQSPRNFTGNYFQGKVTYQPAPRHKLTLSGQTDPTLITRYRQSPYVPDVAEAQQAQGGFLFSTEWLWFASDRVVIRNQFNYKNQYIDVGPVGRNLTVFSGFGPLLGDTSDYGPLDLPGRRGTGAADSSVNFTGYSFNRRDRISYSPKATYYLDDAMGTHEIGVGLDLALLREHTLDGNPGNMVYIDIKEEPGNPTTDTVNYYWFETSGPIEASTRGVETAFYIQDAWKPIDGLTVRGGLRYDKAGLYNDAGKEVIGFSAFSPRLYAAYDLTGDNKTVIRGGYGRFIDPGKLSQSDFLNKHGTGTKLFLGEYFGASTNGAGALYNGTDGESTTLRAGHITAPVTDALRLGFERELINGIGAGIMWNGKWTRHLFEDDDANLIWNEDGSQTIGNRQGVIDNRWRIRTPSHARRYYQNVEFTLRRRFADQLELTGSYTWSRSVGTTGSQYTEALDNPALNQYDFGYLQNDRTHVVRLAATYDFNFGLTMGTTVNFLSGERYEHYYWNDYYGDYANRQADRLTGGRISGAPLWDLRFTYGPKLPGRFGKIGKIKGDITVLNVLNNRQVGYFQQYAYDDRGVKYPDFRQDPISFRLGGRYEF